VSPAEENLSLTNIILNIVEETDVDIFAFIYISFSLDAPSRGPLTRVIFAEILNPADGRGLGQR